MASLIIIALITAVAGVLSSAYWIICTAIRREDRVRGSLRREPTTVSAQSARGFVGFSTSAWN